MNLRWINVKWGNRGPDYLLTVENIRKFDTECARWLAEESPLIGVGVETVGIDAGAAGGFDPPFPVHYYVLGAGKYGVTQLANLGSLPPTGALLVVAPLKLTGGTGSPIRVFAIVQSE